MDVPQLVSEPQSAQVGSSLEHATALANDDVAAGERTSAADRGTSTLPVIHVINGEHYSGAERVQDLLASELPQFGFRVHFACLKPGRFEQQRAYRAAQLVNLPMWSRFDWRAAQHLSELIRSESIAIIHAHTPRSAMIAALAAWQTSVPLVYHVHSPTRNDSTSAWRNRVNALIESVSLRGAARLITVSPSLKRHMEACGVASEKVVYVANGVPPVETAIPRPRPTGTWSMGMIALFRPRKGVEVLLESLAVLRSRGRDVRLRAVGPFETTGYESDVKALTKRLGLEDCVDWRGFANNVQDELGRCDVFVLPSLFGEGLPMVVLEAMAAGVPVVASNVEGVPEAIRHGADGLLVAPGSVSQLSMAVEDLMDGTFDYEVFSERAHTRHSQRFSARAMAAGVAAVYRDVLNTGATPPAQANEAWAPDASAPLAVAY